MIEKYFSGFERKNAVCERTLRIAPPQQEPKYVEIKYDAEPMLTMAFHKPTAPNFDDYVFDILSYMMCYGDSSRLVKDLVIEKRIAKKAVCFNSYPGGRLDNLFVIYAEPYGIETLEGLEKAIIKEFSDFTANPMTKEEFDRVKNQMRATLLYGIDNNSELAEQLVDYENTAKSWQYMISHQKNIEAISIDDFVRTVQKYMVPENMTVVRLKR